MNLISKTNWFFLLLQICTLSTYCQDTAHKTDQKQAIDILKKVKEQEKANMYKHLKSISFTLDGLINNSRQAYDMTIDDLTEDSKEKFISHWFYDFNNKRYRKYTRELYNGGHDLRFEELNRYDSSHYITTQMRKYYSISKPFENTTDDCIYIPGLWLSMLDNETHGLSYLGNSPDGNTIIELSIRDSRKRLYINHAYELVRITWLSNDLMLGTRQNSISYGNRMQLGQFWIPEKIEKYVDKHKQSVRSIRRVDTSPVPDDVFSLDKDLNLFAINPWNLRNVSKNVYQYGGLGGYLYNISFVVFQEFILVYDAILSPAITKKFLSQLEINFPGKPVKYVVLSHNHTDHISGLAGYNSEETTILTTDKTRGRVSQYIDKDDIRCNVETLKPGKSIEITSGNVSAQVINVGETPHVNDMLYVHIKSDDVIIEADSYFRFSPWCKIFTFFFEWIQKRSLENNIIIGTHLEPTPFGKILKARKHQATGYYPQYLRKQKLSDQ